MSSLSDGDSLLEKIIMEKSVVVRGIIIHLIEQCCKYKNNNGKNDNFCNNKPNYLTCAHFNKGYFSFIHLLGSSICIIDPIDDDKDARYNKKKIPNYCTYENTYSFSGLSIVDLPGTGKEK